MKPQSCKAPTKKEQERSSHKNHMKPSYHVFIPLYQNYQSEEMKKRLENTVEFNNELDVIYPSITTYTFSGLHLRQWHALCCSLLLFSAGECTYPGFEGNQFKDHLHCEESSEEHVEDVHGIVEAFGLSVMLQKHTDTHSHTRVTDVRKISQRGPP